VEQQNEARTSVLSSNEGEKISYGEEGGNSQNKGVGRLKGGQQQGAPRKKSGTTGAKNGERREWTVGRRGMQVLLM